MSFLRPKRGNRGGGGGGGGGSGPQQSRPIQTTQGLKEDLTKYEKRREFLQKKANNEMNKAKEMSRKKEKQAAILHLKKKKLYDAEVNKLGNAILTIEQQVIDIESGHLNLDIISTQERGVAEMSRLRRQLDPDRIENVIDQMTEQTDDMAEINEMLMQNGIVDLEDPDILEELDSLLLEEMEETLVEDQELGLPPAISVYKPNVKSDEEAMLELLDLQDAPDAKPVMESANNKSEDDEFRELAAEFA